jgi:diguanylate cyclase (GGDEF)-like protein
MSEWKTRITKVQIVKPQASGESCLVLIYPPGPDMGKRFPLDRDEVVLGRGSDCDVQIDRDSVSRRHCRVFRVGDQWFAEDLQSTNGSYVNDVPIQRAPLRDSDFLKIGAAIFKFLTGAGVEASYHEEIYRMTIVDALTGAHNKRYFIEFLEREIARCSRYGRPLSLLMFDIDHFKSFNDSYGHLTGDQVLRLVGMSLKQTIKGQDITARYGGEEFAVVLPNTGLRQALTVADHIRRAVMAKELKKKSTGEILGRVTISVGVSLLKDGDDTDSLIERADACLYAAKRNGRNRVICELDPEYAAETRGQSQVA